MKYNPYVNELGPKGDLLRMKMAEKLPSQTFTQQVQQSSQQPVQRQLTQSQTMAIDELNSQVSGRAMDVADKSATKFESMISDIVGTIPNPRALPFAIIMNVLKNLALFPLEAGRYAANDMTTAMGVKNTVNVR